MILKVNGKPAKVGQMVTTHDGTTGILHRWREPRNDPGRVYIVTVRGMLDFYPSVIGAKFEEVKPCRRRQ